MTGACCCPCCTAWWTRCSLTTRGSRRRRSRCGAGAGGSTRDCASGWKTVGQHSVHVPGFAFTAGCICWKLEGKQHDQQLPFLVHAYHPCLPQDGPPRPPPSGFESAAALGTRLHSLLDSFDAAPFTLQRLCEVLLEPRKQYARLEKVVSLRCVRACVRALLGKEQPGWLFAAACWHAAVTIYFCALPPCRPACACRPLPLRSC